MNTITIDHMNEILAGVTPHTKMTLDVAVNDEIILTYYVDSVSSIAYEQDM